MAALNRSETEMLQRAHRIVGAVLREGFDKDEPEDSPKRKALEQAKQYINTVVQMKGYYPS